MHFNLINVIRIFPNVYMRNGCTDVLETVAWGLEQLGHRVTMQVNGYDANAVNIVFGGQLLNEEQFNNLPETTIFYNLEDLEITPLERRRKSIFSMAERFRIWDFYAGNLPAWREHKLRFEPVLVPIGYAPTLRRVRQDVNPSIDVLFYGVPAPPRLDVISDLGQAGLRVVYASGFYGAERDGLVAGAKIVLNLYKFNAGKPFEIIRTAFLLANSKAVVSELDPHISIEPDLHEAILLCPRSGMIETCRSLLADDARRLALATHGFEIIQKRDIREFLADAGLYSIG